MHEKYTRNYAPHKPIYNVPLNMITSHLKKKNIFSFAYPKYISKYVIFEILVQQAIIEGVRSLVIRRDCPHIG